LGDTCGSICGIIATKSVYIIVKLERTREPAEPDFKLEEVHYSKAHSVVYFFHVKIAFLKLTVYI